jgi:hypothetical protein
MHEMSSYNRIFFDAYLIHTAAQESSGDFALQVCVGVFGILSTLVAVASLHYRDSLECILFRHFFSFRNLDRTIGAIVFSFQCSFRPLTTPANRDRASFEH